MSTSLISNAYAQNIATVNETRNVVANENICNAQGQLVVKKGTRIDHVLANRITRFKLLRPLEASIVIENELNSETLAECFIAFLNSDKYTRYFYDKYCTPELLKMLCSQVCKYPVLKQKITVLSLIMPSVFEQAMFCAWFGTLLTLRHDGDLNKAIEIFIAGMCHDIGMIHISSKVLNKNSELSANEWRQIHAHPVISQRILEQVKGIPPNVIRAVLEHHETIDGTGYPHAKIGADLCPESQLLSLLDSVNAIYNKRFKPHNRSLSEIIPIIQISQNSRFGPLSNKLIVLLRELPDSQDKPIPDNYIDDVIGVVKSYGKYINNCFDVTKALVKTAGFQHNDTHITSIQNAIIHISMIIHQSGVVNDAYMRWLDQVRQEKLSHAFKEVEEAFLMMQEIIYQIHRLKTLMKLFMDKHRLTDDAQDVSDKILMLNVIRKPPIKPQLNELWLFGT